MPSGRRVLGALVLIFCGAAACSKTSSDQPSAQGGSSAAGKGGQAGQAGTQSHAGRQPSGDSGSGGGAGLGAGGSVGGTATAGTSGDSEGGEAGAPPGGPYQAVHGQLCPVESTLGLVELSGFPTPYVQVALFEGKDPWIGEAELSTASCGFHHYTAGGCPTCQAGETCSLAHTCVPERRTVKDATLLVSAGAAQREYKANSTLGGIYSMLDIGNAASSFAMTLSWGTVEVRLAAMPVASGQLANAVVMTQGDYDAPGALDATWTPSPSGAFVRSRIPINHHAGGPTFTECAAPESAGAFHADAAMIDPLAVKTGLEFQGLEHVFVAAATTPAGCIEFRFGAQVPIFPQ
jgi:hypothetical protein